MKRGGPIPRYTRLRQRTPIKKVNPARKKKLFARNFGDYADVIRSMPCLVCDRYPTEAAHVSARGMGGCKGSKKDLIPLCSRCHTMLDKVMGRGPFERKFQIDLAAEAAALWNEFGEGQEG